MILAAFHTPVLNRGLVARRVRARTRRLCETAAAHAILLLLSSLFGANVLLAADTDQGGKLYRRHCESCHGTDGRGVVPGAPDLTRGQALIGSDVEIARQLQRGAPGKPSFDRILSNRELLDIVSYMRQAF